MVEQDSAADGAQPSGEPSTPTAPEPRAPDAGSEVESMKSELAALRQLVSGVSKAGSGSKGPESNGPLDDLFQDAQRKERYLVSAGFAPPDVAEPAYLDVTRAAREAAIRMGASRILADEEDNEEIEDRGMGAQAERPSDVPDWPPKPFLARQKIYSKGWHRYLLRQDQKESRSDNDPRVAEGDAMSNLMLWLDYASITSRLLDQAIQSRDWQGVEAFQKQTSAYLGAAYDSGRMRVDEISMALLNKASADLFTKTQRMKMDSTTMRTSGVRFLQRSNAAMLTAKAKAVANQRAGTTSSSAGSAGSDFDDKKTDSSGGGQGRGRSGSGRGRRGRGSRQPAATTHDTSKNPTNAESSPPTDEGKPAPGN